MSNRGLEAEEAETVTDMVAIGAIKYTILRQTIGGDVIFDSADSISFEGDSGPYLQYSAVRAGAVLEKSKVESQKSIKIPEKAGQLEKLISRFPDIVERARKEYAPQHIANYLINLAGAFNGFYAAKMIIDANDPESSYRIALTQAFQTTMINGLWLLGVRVPKKM
jgi:arginyl-tRNA synthetase